MDGCAARAADGSFAGDWRRYHGHAEQPARQWALALSCLHGGVDWTLRFKGNACASRPVRTRATPTAFLAAKIFQKAISSLTGGVAQGGFVTGPLLVEA